MLRYTTLHNKFQFNIIKNITNIIATTTKRVVICICTSTHNVIYILSYESFDSSKYNLN